MNLKSRRAVVKALLQAAATLEALGDETNFGHKALKGVAGIAMGQTAKGWSLYYAFYPRGGERIRLISFANGYRSAGEAKQAASKYTKATIARAIKSSQSRGLKMDRMNASTVILFDPDTGEERELGRYD